MNVRRAKREDFGTLIDMGEKFLAQTPWAHLGLDAPSTAETLSELVANPNGLLLVAEEEDEIVGMLGALAFPHYFNKQHTVCQELFWWVEEKARGTGAGRGLLQAAEAWTKELGAKALMMISLRGVPGADAVDRMYEKAGYVPAEHSYVRFL